MNKENKMQIRTDYDKKYDRLLINFGGEVKHSRDFNNINVIFDFNQDDEIVGFEIEDFMKAVKKSDVEVEEIFKASEEQKKEKENEK